MQDLHAWQRADGCTSEYVSQAEPSADGASGTNSATCAFYQHRFLGHDLVLEDGFRDGGGTCDPLGPAQGGAILVVDRRADQKLAAFVENASSMLCKGTDAVTKMMVAALLASEVLGRSDGDADALEARRKDLTLAKMDVAAGTVRLGDLLTNKPGNDSSGLRQLGAGGVRERSVLVKAMADWLDLAPCALCRDEDGHATWNLVFFKDGRFIVDVMFDPGAMYEDKSPRALEYLARLQHQDGGSKIACAPSVQKGIEGRMVRPSWHVEPWEVDFSRCDRAGRGGFGEVFRGRWAGQAVAIKEVKDASPTDMEVCQFILEISLLSGLSHPNIVRFWRGCVDLRGGNHTLLLVTEWMDRGVLSELLYGAQDKPLSRGQRFVLGVAVGRGVAYLHEVGVLHLDLKSPNVLLNSSFEVKLCDFGLAKVRERVGVHTTLRGVSPVYAPPEMFDDSVGGISEKADVYSFGIVIFELFTRQIPFAELAHLQLTRAKAKGQMPKFPSGLEKDITDVIQLCLAQRPSSRPQMSGALSQLGQLATNSGINLAEERSQMESQGLHYGSHDAKSEQTRQMEADSLEAEADIVRLRKLLREEDGKTRMLEEQIRQSSTKASSDSDPTGKFTEFYAMHTEKLDNMKFRCNLCMKLFRGEESAQKHIQERHLGEMLAEAGCLELLYLDTDVAEESHVQIYTNKMDQLGGKQPVNRKLSRAMQDAARNGDVGEAQQCVQRDASELSQTDTDGCTPLHLSALHGHEAVARYLLQHIADVGSRNDNGLAALHLASQEGHLQVVEALLQALALPDVQDAVRCRSPLHLACAKGHVDVCRALLARRANVNAQDSDGVDAIHCAARFGSADLCELVLSWGASVNSVDNDGWCAIHEAARWGDGGLVEVLLRRGAELHAMTNDGESPLHLVPGGCAEQEVVEVLLACQAQVNAVDYDGETPLHVAVKLGDEGLVDVFLAHGADANSKTKGGATPLDLAKKDEIKWLLRSHKARRGGASS